MYFISFKIYAWNGTYNFIVFIFSRNISFFSFSRSFSHSYVKIKYDILHSHPFFLLFGSLSSTLFSFSVFPKLKLKLECCTVATRPSFVETNLGKQYAMAATEQADLCRQNRKSFFSSPFRFSFLLFLVFPNMLMVLLCGSLFAERICVDFPSQND